MNNICYDEAGFGSTTSTFKEAFQTYKTITFTYVKQWLQSNIETTKQVKCSNSFAAPYPYYGYQLDLAAFSNYKTQNMNNV
jgi:hypothetical protein